MESFCGDHCTYALCNQLDFLPFTCGKCEHVFCRDHRAPHTHECALTIETHKERVQRLERAAAKRRVQARKKANKNKYKCYVRKCRKGSEETTTRCQACREQFCLSHRFPLDHKCGKAKAVFASKGPVSKHVAPSQNKLLAALSITNPLRAMGILPQLPPSLSSSTSGSVPSSTSASVSLEAPVKNSVSTKTETDAYLTALASRATPQSCSIESADATASRSSTNSNLSTGNDHDADGNSVSTKTETDAYLTALASRATPQSCSVESADATALRSSSNSNLSTGNDHDADGSPTAPGGRTRKTNLAHSRLLQGAR